MLLIELGCEFGMLRNDWFLDYDLLICKVMIVVMYDIVLVVIVVLGVNDSWVYISSGIWLLIGVENKLLILIDLVLKNNYINECGVNNIICFFKNIIGMWVI